MITLKKLKDQEWKDRQLEFVYSTDGFYDFKCQGYNFSLELHRDGVQKEVRFTDKLFGAWLERPSAYGAYSGDVLLGIIEFSPESWNNRLRVSNLLVFKDYRRKGVGRTLLGKAIVYGKNHGFRMIVLETQTCNINAIGFYLSMGFEPIGFDLNSYSNADIDQCEVRLEMGKKLL